MKKLRIALTFLLACVQPHSWYPTGQTNDLTRADSHSPPSEFRSAAYSHRFYLVIQFPKLIFWYNEFGQR